VNEPETISDKRLKELVAEYGRVQQWVGQTDTWLSVTACLFELQSRRAAEQAALPEVEMAEKLTRFVEAKVGEYLPGDITLPDDEARAIRELLAPLYAKLADLEQQLARKQQFVADQNKAIAERDELLGDARVYVDPCPADEDRKPHRNQLLARIDALLGAKGGDDETTM